MHLEEILQHHGFDLSSLSLPAYQRAGKDHPIYLLQIPAMQALEQWEALRNLVPETGYWPVIGWNRFKQPPWEEETFQEILGAASQVDVQAWLQQQWVEQRGEERIRREGTRKQEDEQALAPFTFRFHLRWLSGVPPLVPIALVPTGTCWEVPAYLTAQANDWDPPDAVHVALMKYWNERWKAEVVSLNAGVMEMRVLQPPTTFEEAFALAKEQYVYAPDVVDQWLRGNLHTLARMLLNGHVWSFWWD